MPGGSIGGLVIWASLSLCIATSYIFSLPCFYILYQHKVELPEWEYYVPLFAPLFAAVPAMLVTTLGGAQVRSYALLLTSVVGASYPLMRTILGNRVSRHAAQAISILFAGVVATAVCIYIYHAKSGW